MTEEFSWDYPSPFITPLVVKAGDIDALGHANNVVYLDWVQNIAWAHSCSKSVDMKKYLELDRAMVARKHELFYIAPCFEGDEILLATWIKENDGKLSIERRYQFVRVSDGQTLFRGGSQWVCISISSGKPKRMPKEFLEAYCTTI